MIIALLVTAFIGFNAYHAVKATKEVNKAERQLATLKAAL